MGMELVDKIREAYCDAIAPLLRSQEESMKRCRNQEQRYQCINAYARLHLAEYDRVCQRFGLPPVQYQMEPPHKAVRHNAG